MLPESRWLLPLLLTFACDGGAAPQPKVSPSKPEPTPAKQDPPGAAKESDVEAPASAAAIEEEWLVWFDAGGGLQSRWYTTTSESTASTAQRSALAVADGGTLWHVRRKDASADVFACECIESEKDPACRKTGSVKTLGLEAVSMDGGTPVALVTGSTESVSGNVDALTLSMRGGVGARLMVETTDAGYYCGAHGSYGGSTRMLEVPSGKGLEWPGVKLPDVMLREAALFEDMLKNYQECWDKPEVTMAAFVGDLMEIVDVGMSLDAGMVRLRWHAEADGPYVCTGDYAFHGYVETTLMPPAAALGLAPPLSAGLQAALTDVGDATAVGWSKLERTGTARAEALTWFRGLDETPWPSGDTKQVDVAEAPEQDTNASRGLLAEGRKLTKAKDYAGADAALTRAIKLDPEAARPYAARCYARLLAGTLKPARKDCNKALTLHPGDRFAASVHYNLGQIALREGDTAKARVSYEASLNLRDNDTVRHALKNLE